MKTKKNAASAALKPNDTKPTTTVAAKAAPGAPKLTASAPATTTSAPKRSAEVLTTIDVKINVGFGNAVFLRGKGTGLTWDHGVALSCVDDGTWRWTQKVADPVTFKVLLNDQVWSAGSDIVVTPGQKVEISPSFA